MRILSPSTIPSIAASSSHANYPAYHMWSEESPDITWQAATSAVNSAAITWQTSGYTDAIVLVNCTCPTIAVEVSVDNVNWASLTITETMRMTDSLRGTENVWLTYAVVHARYFRMTVSKTSGDPTLQIGVFVTGLNKDVDGVEYPLDEESPRDTSIVTEMANGSYNYRPRKILRRFSGTALALRGTQYYDIINLFRWAGSTPIAFHLSPATDNDEWFLWGRCMRLPSGAHVLPTRSRLQFDIEEVW